MIPGTRPVNLCNDKSSRVKVQFWPFLARDSRRSRTVNKFSNRISSRRTSSLQAREWRRVCMECRVECIPPQVLNTPETSQMIWPQTGHIWSQMTQWWQFRQFRFTNFHHETRKRWASLRLPQSQHSTAEVESPSARAERFRTSGGSWGAAKNDISTVSPCVTTYSRSACYNVSMFGRLDSVLRSNELVKLWSNFALVSLI